MANKGQQLFANIDAHIDKVLSKYAYMTIHFDWLHLYSSKFMNISGNYDTRENEKNRSERKGQVMIKYNNGAVAS